MLSVWQPALGFTYVDGIAQEFGTYPLVSLSVGSLSTELYAGEHMGYQRIGDTMRIVFTIQTSTGPVNADSTPTVTVLNQGVVMGYAPTVTNIATGVYEIAFILTIGNGFNITHEFSAYVTATVNSVSYVRALTAFTLETRRIDDLAYPVTSGRSLAVDASGNASANVTLWQGSAPDALSSGKIPADLKLWLASAPASLSTSGYVQAILQRWLTDNIAGTPNALVSGKVDANAASSGGGGGVSGPSLKTQFISTESVKLVFPPFVDKTTGNQYLGTDTVTLTIVKPDSTVLVSPPTPIFDVNANLWTATLASANFSLGQWLVKAVSNGANTTPQNQVFTWGDYVDDLEELRKAALGKWKVDSVAKQLILYEDDGVTVFKTFDLKDASGNPTVDQIFERNPV